MLSPVYYSIHITAVQYSKAVHWRLPGFVLVRHYWFAWLASVLPGCLGLSSNQIVSS